MSLILSAAVATDVGLVRTNNEDSAHVGQRLVAIADGIGGLPAGELASDIVIRALAGVEDRADTDDPVGLLTRTVEAANVRILQAGASDPAHEGMGTTITALLLAPAGLALVHVGDSRCYRYRDGVMTQITKDDTFVQTLVDEGVLSREDARVHPRRSLVTQAVQGHDFTPACEVMVARRGDRYLLCSDGLSDFVTDDAIARTLGANSDAKRCARALVGLALDAGGHDNVTVIVADVADA